MAHPGRDVSMTLAAADAVDNVMVALGTQGFTSRGAAADGTVVMRRGRTGLGVAVEAASEIVPLWLLPAGRKHMFAFDIRIRVVTGSSTTSTLRLDLERRASATVVDQQFETALAALHSALESQGVTCVWGDLTDSATEPGRNGR